MVVRQAIRWGLRHGMVRRAVERRVRAGDPTARLMVDPAMIADPFGHYALTSENVDGLLGDEDDQGDDSGVGQRELVNA